MRESSKKRSRSRSRSPSRKASKGSGGFRWKEKRTDDKDQDTDRHRGMQRGYRNRSPPRRGYEPRDDNDDRERETDPRQENKTRDARKRDGDEGDGEQDRRRTRDEERATVDNVDAVKPNDDDDGKKERKKKKKKAKNAVAGPVEEMIQVNVNDRLGTKTQIPCLPSDTIQQLKVMVAMRIGREPHEILLKRQGERPFKNQLTLADYSIGNGVQLDLEMDTGD